MFPSCCRGCDRREARGKQSGEAKSGNEDKLNNPMSGKPVTPMVGCDVFIADECGRVLLIRRRDNGFWALPGRCQDLGETPAGCARRECREETGLEVRVTRLLGVFSSRCYEYVNYPWKDNEFCHVLFLAVVTGGELLATDETTGAAYFAEGELPELSDGHRSRVAVGFRALRVIGAEPHFE